MGAQLHIYAVFYLSGLEKQDYYIIMWELKVLKKNIK